MDISSTNCARCKQKVKEGANFCIYCGYKLANNPSKLNSCKSESKSKYQINVSKAKSVYDIKKLPSSPSSHRNMSALHKKSKISIPSRYSFNKTTSKKLLSEEFDFLMRPNTASFISYRDDSKYFKDVESKDKTLDEIQDMIDLLEINNSINIEKSYDKLSTKPIPVNRAIDSLYVEPAILSDNTIELNPFLKFRDSYTIDYLSDVIPIDQLYRNKLEDQKKAHLLKPIIDGKLADDDRGHDGREVSTNDAWYWGNHHTNHTTSSGFNDDTYPKEYDDKYEFDGELEGDDKKTYNNSFYWGDKFENFHNEDEDEDEYSKQEDDDDGIDVNNNMSSNLPNDNVKNLDTRESEAKEAKECKESKQEELSIENKSFDFNDDTNGKNSPAVIVQLYSKSCQVMTRCIQEAVLDFTKDALYQPNAIQDYISIITHVREVLEFSLRTDHQAAYEYQLFQKYWSELRASVAHKVSALFEEAAHMQTKFDVKYQQLQEDFLEMQSRSNLQLVRPSTSNKQMDDLKSQAEKELSLIGNQIQKAQAAEAQIIMEYRSTELTVINSITQWKASFGKLFAKLQYDLNKFNLALHNTAARKIQRAVWRKLFKWDPRTHRPPLPYDPRADELYVRTIEKP